MRKRFLAVFAVLLMALAPLAARSGSLSLRDDITRQTGVSPQETDSGALTGCFHGAVPGVENTGQNAAQKDQCQCAAEQDEC